jgi:hypothetical protein
MLEQRALWQRLWRKQCATFGLGHLDTSASIKVDASMTLSAMFGSTARALASSSLLAEYNWWKARNERKL